MYISNNYINSSITGYNIRFENGDINTKKFINTFDYSLDLIKLKEIYELVYRNQYFTFGNNKKQFTQKVINVTFKYSNKLFNKIKGNIYIKFGYAMKDVNFKDHVCIINNELIAIETEVSVEQVISNDLFENCFYYEGGVYRAKKSIKSLNNVSDLRNKLYNDGFYCDGVKYKRFKRSSGSSRVGKCLFIDEKLYEKFHKWEMCGTNIKENQEIDLAAFESYIALPTSSIIDTVEINPDNILVIEDYESIFTDEAIAITSEDGWLKSEEKVVEIKNSIWDGQSLLDISVFENYSSYGMLLLRNRFFKSCGFNTNIQQWFEDNNITELNQLNGFTLAKSIKDIKMITTNSSIKYIKFGSIEKWLSNIDSTYGIVKHDKPTHFFEGKMTQMHYQLLNTLQLSYDDVGKLIQPSLDYMKLLKSNPTVLRNHIKYPDNFNFEITAITSKNDIIYNMIGINEKFTKTKFYIEFVNDLLKSYKKNLRCGHILIHGNYSTLFGNPVEMLQQSIGMFKGESQIGIGNIHSSNFDYDKTILGSRSPHVTIGNVWITTNTTNAIIDNYFNLTKEIVCVNSINENLLERLSGSDFDSDTALLTDESILIDAALKNYSLFKVPTNLVSANKIKRKYNNAEKADLDVKTSVNKIGEIINLSQELNTLIWDGLNSGKKFDDIKDIYYDAAKLDIMSNLEIDKAKKEYDVDNVAEIKKIKSKYQLQDQETGRYIKPYFLGEIAKPKGYYNNSTKYYKQHDTSMDYLQKHLNKFRFEKSSNTYLPFVSILNKDNFNSSYIKYDQIERIFNLISDTRKEIQSIYESENLDKNEKFLLSNEVRQSCVEYIDTIKISYSTMYWILYLMNDPQHKKLTNSLFSILFGTPNKSFFEAIKKSKEKLPILIENPLGDIDLYGLKYSGIYKNQ